MVLSCTPCALRGALGCRARHLVLYHNALTPSLTPYLLPHSLHSPYPRALHSHHSRSCRPHSPDHKFVKTQFDTWEEQKAKDDMGPHFIPTPGFVVKTFDRGTGVKVRSNTRAYLYTM